MAEMGFIKKQKKSVNKDTIVPMTFTHSCVIGQTGCGKTTSYIYPNLENRVKHGHAILLYDYKGKEHSSVKAFAQKHNRLGDIIEIGSVGGSRINFLEHIQPHELHNLFTKIYHDSGDNAFWFQSAANYSTLIMKFAYHFRALNRFPLFRKNRLYRNKIINKSGYGDDYSFYGLNEVVKSISSLRDFVLKIDDLKIEIEETIRRIYKKAQPSQEIMEEGYELFLKLSDVIDAIENSMSLFKNRSQGIERNQTTHQISMQNQISGLATLEQFNKVDIDIVQALNSGKIIIIQTQSIPNLFLNLYTSSLLLKMSQRVYMDNPKPLSVFIDEMQRVVSKGTDLPLDILRESNIDLIASFQNVKLMEEAMGKDSFLSLFGNFANIYLYANNIGIQGVETEHLLTFEYKYLSDTHENTYGAKPLFLSSSEKFEAEIAFNDINGIYDKFEIEDRECVIVNRDGDYINLKDRSGKVIRVRIKDFKYKNRIESFIADFKKISDDDSEMNESFDFPTIEPLHSKRQHDIEELVGAFKRKLRSDYIAS